MPNVWMGYDPREKLAYAVAERSILRRTEGVTVQPIGLDAKPLTRPVERRGNKLWCPISEAPMATEFAISRFAVPFLQKTGWALFCDCDIICLADIRELFALADPQYAVMVVKHQYQPTATEKMDGQVQTRYPRKNWSSVMLVNCDHPGTKRFTLEILNTWPGRDLHAFLWLEEREIGELPSWWNHLVGASPHPWVNQPKILHYTMGGPWLPDWTVGPLDDVWNQERKECGL